MHARATSPCCFPNHRHLNCLQGALVEPEEVFIIKPFPVSQLSVPLKTAVPEICCPPPSGQPRTFREAAAGLLGAPGLRSSRLASGLWFPSSCFRCGGRKFAGGGRARSRPATRSCFPATWKGPLGTTESREPLPHLPTHPSMPGVKAVRAARTGGSTLVYV